MSLYNIDLDVLVQLLVPSRLRKAKTLAWIGALIAPIRTLLSDFMSFKATKDYELAHNGQVCRLEGLLNDRWDAGLRRITIEDTPDVDPVFFYLEAEQKPEFFYLESENQQKFFYLESETTTGYDFEVRVPNFISFDNTEMTALVNKYKLTGRSFIIKTI